MLTQQLALGKVLCFRKRFGIMVENSLKISSLVLSNGENNKNNKKKADHRIIEWFELEGTLQDHLVQLPHSEQEHLQLH